MKSYWKIIGGILAVFLIFSGLRSLGLFETKEVYIEKESHDEKSQETEQPKKEVKSATLTIDKIQIQLGNLYPTRVTVTNTGDINITPKFDLYVYDPSNNEVCSGSPLIDEFEIIEAGKNKTGEISIIGCMFKEDGAYTLKVDLLDQDYNRLDSKTKDFEVDYWSQFKI